MSTQAATQEGQAPVAIQPQGGNLPQSVFKNEGVDTSARALERNELGEKSGYDAATESPVPQVATPDAPPAEPQSGSQPAPVVTSGKQLSKEEFDAILDAEAPELINGKYKTIREQIKGYGESQKGFAEKVKVEAAKQAETLAEKRATEVLAEKLRGLVQPQQDAQQIAQVTQKSLDSMSPDEHLDMLTRDPQAYNKMIREETQRETLRYIRANEVREAWNRDNADLLKMEILPAQNGKPSVTGESLVSFFTLTLAQQNPQLLADGTGESALREATAVVRNLLSSQQNLGKQQAMVVRETVTPLQSTTTGTASADNRAPQAPAVETIADPVAHEVERLRAERARVTRQPVVRM